MVLTVGVSRTFPLFALGVGVSVGVFVPLLSHFLVAISPFRLHNPASRSRGPFLKGAPPEEFVGEDFVHTLLDTSFLESSSSLDP